MAPLELSHLPVEQLLGFVQIVLVIARRQALRYADKQTELTDNHFSQKWLQVATGKDQRGIKSGKTVRTVRKILVNHQQFQILMCCRMAFTERINFDFSLSRSACINSATAYVDNAGFFLILSSALFCQSA